MKEREKEKEFITEMIQVTESFQSECHNLVSEILTEKPLISVQDATDVWIFKKLAEF